MWLRSQDKKTLINSNCVEVLDNVIVAYTGELRRPLGKYETQERVLEVLDQIEHRLICGNSHDDMSGNRRVQKQFVFHMPEK